MILRSNAFAAGEAIPRKYTSNGLDLSPPLAWWGVPDEAASLALVCDDPDGPGGTWVHWILYNIPSVMTGLPEDIPAKLRLPNGICQGLNDFQRIGYGGPCPAGGGAHRYRFTLYALSEAPRLAGGATKQELLRAINGSVLCQAQLTAVYATRAAQPLGAA